MSDERKVPRFWKYFNGAEPRRAVRGKPERSGSESGTVSNSAEMPTAPNPFRKYLRVILAWMFAPPAWKVECQAAINAFQEDNRRVIAQMDEDIAAFKSAEAPRVERSSQPFDEAAK